MKKNQEIPLTVTGMTAEGSGVGRKDGMVVFVPNSAVGDELTVRIIKTSKSYCVGKIVSVDAPSPDRIEPDCPVFSQCGGCVYRHLTYESECRIKQQRVTDAVRKIGGFDDLPVLPILGAEKTDRYRNKAQYPVGRSKDGTPVFGFYAGRTHRIVPCDDCALQPERFSAAIGAVRKWLEESGESIYDETTGQGRLRHLYLREGGGTGDLMVCLVVNGKRVKQEERLIALLREALPNLTSVVLNENREKTNVILGKNFHTLWGSDDITDLLRGVKFHIAPAAFYQVNRAQTERLYALAERYAALTGEETLLDLYCGAGTIGLTMAKNVKRLIGVEIVPQAVENARRNALENHIANAEFLCADAAEAAELLKKRGERPDVILLDPPRKGCDSALIETVVQMAPRRIVYVSCDPATLARDLRRFDDLGYTPREVTPVDLFPRTAHVETVVLMSRK